MENFIFCAVIIVLTKIIVSLGFPLSEKRGSMVWFNLAKYFFFTFSKGRHSSFFVCYRVLCLGQWDFLRICF